MDEFLQDGRFPDRTRAAYLYKQAAGHRNVRGMYRLPIYYYGQGNDNSAYNFEQAANKEMPAATALPAIS